MKVSHRSSNGRVEIFAEGESQKEVFRQLASLQEVFEETHCGVCGNEDIRFIVRTAEGNDFYEMHCLDLKCRARLAFGQIKGKEGMLWPKRKAEDKKTWLPHRGWFKWTGEPKKEEAL